MLKTEEQERSNTHTKWHSPNTDPPDIPTRPLTHGEVPPKGVHWPLGSYGCLWTPGLVDLPQTAPQCQASWQSWAPTWLLRYHFPWDQLLDLHRKKCQNRKGSPHTSRPTLTCGRPSSCVQRVPPPSTLSKVACPLPPACLALYSLGVVGAQSYLGKVLFCLETLLPTSPYPLWPGRARGRGEVSQDPQLLPSLSPPFSTSPIPVPSLALCLAHLPQYFHLITPPKRQLVWGLRMVVKQDPVGLGVGGWGEFSSLKPNPLPKRVIGSLLHQPTWAPPPPSHRGLGKRILRGPLAECSPVCR